MPENVRITDGYLSLAAGMVKQAIEANDLEWLKGEQCELILDTWSVNQESFLDKVVLGKNLKIR